MKVIKKEGRYLLWYPDTNAISKTMMREVGRWLGEHFTSLYNIDVDYNPHILYDSLDLRGYKQLI